MISCDEIIVSKDTYREQASEIHSERIDDIPLLLHILQEMGVPEQIDSAYSPHPNWQGLSLGWVATVWLAYILTQCDHRMNRVRDWVNARRDALSQLIVHPIRFTDFTDDRLAEVLGYLSVNAIWHQVESGISQRAIRVYDLELGTIRLDATVGQVYHDPEQHTLFQVGHTKAGDYDTQFKLMLGALDPMGLPVAVDVVSGEQADDPLYLPVYIRIHQTLGKRGLLYVGDAKMSAVQTRATIKINGDYYLVPLAMVGETPQLLDSLLDALDAGEFETTTISLSDVGEGRLNPLLESVQDPLVERVPTENLSVGTQRFAVKPLRLSPQNLSRLLEKDEAIAEGFETIIERTAEVGGQRIFWTERLFCVKSFRYAETQQKGLEDRLQQAQTALRALTPPKGRGKKQYIDETALKAVIDQILERYKVKGLIDVTNERIETQRRIRGYGGRPARTETNVCFKVSVHPNAEAIAQEKKRLGFRIYATNAPVERLVLLKAVLTYRDQYIAERDFARLHGRHLGITPLYVQRDDHAMGLIRLLTLALRGMVLLEFIARRKLAQQNATLSGIYAGNPTRATARPTAERLLAQFKEITLTTIHKPDGRWVRHLTPLTPVQETILALIDIPVRVYTAIMTGIEET
jgi:transposase